MKGESMTVNRTKILTMICHQGNAARIECDMNFTLTFKGLAM